MRKTGVLEFGNVVGLVMSHQHLWKIKV